MEVARDVREGGTWTVLQRVKNDAIYVAVSIALALAGSAPGGALRLGGRALGRLAFWLLPRARRTALANLARAFPRLSPSEQRTLAARTYAALGTRLGEAVASLEGELAPMTWAEGSLDVLRDALDEGAGVVFASAHLGPWEHVASTMVASGLPLTVVAREAYDPRLTPLYERLRGGRGVRAIWRGSPGAARGLLRTLKRGQVLGIPMDLASRVPSVTVPFLDVPAPTPVGPARMALRMKSAVVVGSVAPGPRGELVISATRIDTTDLEPGAAGEHALTTRINAELSRRIRAVPELWPWMHPRFPTL